MTGMAKTHITRKRRGRGQAGMTLVEVVMSFGMLTAVLLGFSYMALGSANLNRKTELLVSGTNAINAQLATMTSAAAADKLYYGSQSVGLVQYLYNLESALPKEAGFPISVSFDRNKGIISYEFPVSAPGSVVSDYSIEYDGTSYKADKDAIEKDRFVHGRGVMKVFLKEDFVPSSFYNWEDLQLTPSGEVSTPDSNRFFDMDSDGADGADYTLLWDTYDGEQYPSLSLPVTVTVVYYASEAQLEKARQLESQNDLYFDLSQGIASVSRNYIVNDTAIRFVD